MRYIYRHAVCMSRLDASAAWHHAFIPLLPRVRACVRVRGYVGIMDPINQQALGVRTHTHTCHGVEWP